MEPVIVLGREVISLSKLREGKEDISFAVPSGTQSVSVTRSGQHIQIEFIQDYALDRVLRTGSVKEGQDTESVKSHIPLHMWRWNDKPDEISWKCSCGASNIHVKLPADLECEYDMNPRPKRDRVLRTVSDTAVRG